MASDWPCTFLQPGCFCLAYTLLDESEEEQTGLGKEVHSARGDSAITDSMTPFLSRTREYNGKPFFLLQR